MNRPEPALSFYRASVFHARLRPCARRFRYGVLSMLVDIDRLGTADRSSRIFSVGRFNLLGFNAADHGPRDGSSLRTHVEALCESAGLSQKPCSIDLMCFPRILGFVFNPLSVYFCKDAGGQLVALVYEVRNTFGEIHNYVALAQADAKGFIDAHECEKDFYVSPFIDLGLRYRFLAQAPGETLGLKIIESDGNGVLLTALLRGERLPMNAWHLARAAFDTPLAGFKVLAAIHWQAFLLLCRGLRLRPRPAPPLAASIARLSPSSRPASERPAHRPYHVGLK